MEFLLTDLRHSWRKALHQPTSTLAIILLLSLGIGGVSVVFNPIYSMLFTPLPFPQSERLVRIGGNIPIFNNLSRFEKEEFLERIFSNIAAYISSDQNAATTSKVNIRSLETGKHKNVFSLWVTEGFFKTLGVQPLIGSWLNINENRDGVVISYRLWHDVFEGAPNAIGNEIYLPSDADILFGINNGMRRVVGIMPDGFNFPLNTDIWMIRSGGRQWGFGSGTTFIGRLRPGISSEQAVNDLKAIDFNPIQGSIRSEGPVLQPLQTVLYGDQRSLLRLLGTASVLFIALACTGVANILITQSANRKQEIATRLIYGATRRNLIFKLLREILPLVVIGGLTGWWLSEVVSKWLWTQLPILRNGAANVSVSIIFLASLVLIVTIISGLIPSLYATGIDLNTYLKSVTGTMRRFLPSRELLLGVQLGLALALLIGVSLLLRSMVSLVDFSIGWSSREIAVVSVLTSAPIPIDSSRTVRTFQDVRRELSEMPEVVSVGYLSPIPFSTDATRSIQLLLPTSKDLPLQGGPQGPAVVSGAQADQNGFDLLNIKFISGRPFNSEDFFNRVELLRKGGGRGRNGGVAIINQALAQRLWQGKNPVGNIIFDGTTAYYEIVGVVRNYHLTPESNDFIPMLFTPMTGINTSYHLLARLRPGTLLNNFRANVQQRLYGIEESREFDVQLLSDHVKDVMESRRLTLQLLGCFSILGIIVSLLGVYATTTLMIKSRNHEIGIRMAIGAQSGDILRLALWGGIRSIVVGLPVGLFLAWVLSKMLSGFLNQVNINFPFSWVFSCATFVIMVTIAALIPALRATRINSWDALRNE